MRRGRVKEQQRRGPNRMTLESSAPDVRQPRSSPCSRGALPSQVVKIAELFLGAISLAWLGAQEQPRSGRLGGRPPGPPTDPEVARLRRSPGSYDRLHRRVDRNGAGRRRGEVGQGGEHRRARAAHLTSYARRSSSPCRRWNLDVPVAPRGTTPLSSPCRRWILDVPVALTPKYFDVS